MQKIVQLFTETLSPEQEHLIRQIIREEIKAYMLEQASRPEGTNEQRNDNDKRA